VAKYSGVTLRFKHFVCRMQYAGVHGLTEEMRALTEKPFDVAPTVSEGTGDVLPIARRTLHDEVVDRLRDLIIQDRLAPGTRINEVQLGALLGVSRTPLREAIKTLAREGLVENAPSRGAIVRRFSEADVVQILEVLKVMEQLAARLVCARASEAAIAHIEELHQRMIGFYKTGDRLEYFKL